MLSRTTLGTGAVGQKGPRGLTMQGELLFLHNPNRMVVSIKSSLRRGHRHPLSVWVETDNGLRLLLEEYLCLLR